MRTPPKDFLVWLAGFVDGEGWIGMTNNGNNTYPILSVVNTYKPALVLIKRQFGVGTIDSQQKQSPSHKQVYRIRFLGTSAQFVLQLIRNFLVVKQDQADLVLGCHVKRSRFDKLDTSQLCENAEYYNALRNLNKRGI